MNAPHYAPALGAALLLVACGNAGAPPAEDAALAAVRERILGKESCDDRGLVSSIVAPGEGIDCILHPANLAEGGDIRLIVTADPIDEAGEVAGAMRVEVAKLDGASLQVIEEAGLTRLMYPWMIDVDGKNGLDLVITRDVGNVNSVWSMHLEDGKGTYVAAGYLTGVDHQVDANGLIVTAARSSADTVNYAFTRVSEDLTFEGVATVETVAQTDAAGAFTGAWACRLLLSEDPALTEAELCAHPVVVGTGE